MRTPELIQVFHDTQMCIESEPELKQATEESCRLTKVYGEEFLSKNKRIKSQGYNVLTAECYSLECARRLSNGKDRIAVLNFANPFEPGGGVLRGSVAQEENLCRCSNLYNSISTPGIIEQYYEKHTANKKNYLFSDRLVYSPGIVVLKDDRSYERLADSFLVDIITCAAPYNVYGHDPELLKSTYRRRLTNLFEVAAENDVDVLILGAFGCGVFHNPPELMAGMFRELIEKTYYAYFKQIWFPLSKSKFTRNYEVFSKILSAE